MVKLKMKSLICFSILCILQCYGKKIAIIGGGIGGTATAYFLRQYLGPDYTIDLFEANKVGGRLAVVNVAGREYEAGGAIIHPRNKHMQDFVKAMVLEHRKEAGLGKFGLYDGKELVFTESNYSFFTTIKLFWRYGFSLWTLDKLLNKRLDMFDRIYDYQEKGVSFKTVKSLLKAMSNDFPMSTETSAKKGMTSSGLSEKLVDELVAAAMRVNYGQNMIDTHDFLAFVSIAGADSGLWAVKDGNYQVPKNLLRVSQATLMPFKVYKISDMDSRYKVYWRDFNNNSGNETYDAVVIATPITDELKYKMEMPDLVNRVPSRHMHKLVCTWVQGELNYSTFGVSKEDGLVDIMTVEDNPWFNSFGRVYPVDGSDDDKPVYKVFSSAPLNAEQLETLFSEQNEVKEVTWFAYPHYSYKEPLEGHFILRDGLFYVNAIEWAASAMEMSSISAKNVALLVRNYFNPNLQQEYYEQAANKATKTEL